MRISFGINSTNSVLSFVNEKIIRPWTSREKMIGIIILAALGCLAAVYLVYRHWNKDKQAKSLVGEDIPQKSKQVPALAELRNEIAELKKENKHEEIIVRCQDILAIDPQHKQAFVQYVYALDALGKSEEVVIKGKELFEKYPDDALCLDIYTRNLCLLGNLEEAASAYVKYLKCDPDNDVAIAFYGNILLQQGKYDEAEKQFQYALKIKPESEYTLNHYADSLRRQGKFLEAKSMIDKALSHPASLWNIETITCHAMILWDLGKNDEALKEFERGNKLDSKNADFLKKYADFLEHKSKYNEAQAKLKEAQQIDSSQTLIVPQTNEGGQLEKPETQSNGNLQFHSSISNAEESALSLHAHALMSSKKFDEAAKLYEKLVEMTPGNMEYLEYYGHCLDASGQRLKNAEMIAKAVTAYPFETTTLIMYTTYVAKYKLEDQNAYAMLGTAPIDQIKQTVLGAQELPSSHPCSTAEQTGGTIVTGAPVSSVVTGAPVSSVVIVN